MELYLYDEITKEYKETIEAYLDPAETALKGEPVYMYPANSTGIKPPVAGDNEIVLFENDNWVIKPDYRGLYQCNEDFDVTPIDKFGELENGYVVITKEQAGKIAEDKLYYVIIDGELVENPNYKEEKANQRQAQFTKDFFQTSLGYVRRKVSMATGETKDFLSDLLPTISMGVQMGQPVTIITYNEPDFTTDEIDWVALQEVKTVTAQFVQECFLQLSNDFKPVEPDVEEKEDESTTNN